MKEKIFEFIKENKGSRSTELVKKFGLSRQTVSKHLRKLLFDGLIEKTGSTKNSRYYVRSSAAHDKDISNLNLSRKILNLDEDKVYNEVKMRLNLSQKLSKNVLAIFNYAFTEILNNAIDHSISKNSEIDVLIEKGSISFIIRDFGIGIFKNVQDKFQLDNEFEGAEHVFKGKQTTAPTRHSGEGIFFTSRIADVFAIKSHNIGVKIDNKLNDVYYEKITHLKGTHVFFKIKQRSKKRLEDLFRQFVNENFIFDKNIVRVRLSNFNELMSRSVAKRILNGLVKFQRITLDFKGVQGVGQAFVDEVFRVFKLNNPTISIDYINANQAIEFLIKRCCPN